MKKAFTCEMCNVQLKGETKQQVLNKIRQHFAENHGIHDLPDSELESREALIRDI